MARKAAIILIFVMVTVGVVDLALLQRVHAAGQTWIVISAADSGWGTLRSGLLNATAGDSVTFDSSVFPPTSPVYINLTSELPHITQGNLTIDASGAGVILNGNHTPIDTVGLVVDSENNTIKGLKILNFPGSGIRLTANARECSISGNTITNNGNGIYLDGSSNNNVSGNTIPNNGNGIELYESSNNTISGNNIINSLGIYLSHSSGNTISENNLTNNDSWSINLWLSSNNSLYGNNVTKHNVGIALEHSPYNTLRNNSIADLIARNILASNFWVSGAELPHFIQDADQSNIVEGKPICYWVNRRNEVIPSDAGYVALINSHNITVEGLELKNNGPGILLVNTTNSLVKDNNVTNNCLNGVTLWSSSYNTLSGNNITNNRTDDGVYLHNSSSNTLNKNAIEDNYKNGFRLFVSSNNNISQNNITNNGEIGVWLDSSDNNTVSENMIMNNGDGLCLRFGSYNNITDNNITNNDGYGAFAHSLSKNNRLTRNTIANNERGVTIDSHNNTISTNNITNNHAWGIKLRAYYNTISGNIIANNLDEGIWLFEAAYNTISNNTITNNSMGIEIGSSTHHNQIYHNNFLNNTVQAWSYEATFWDDSYPSGGNYWSDYNGTDLYSGPHQNITGSDGIGDTPYPIEASNQDNYPFMKPWGWDVESPSIGKASQEPEVPDDNEKVTVTVDVTDLESGVHNVTISYSTDGGETWNNITMIKTSGDTYEGEILGLPDGTNVQYKIIAYDKVGNPAVEDNVGSYYVYTVIPEFPSFLILPLFMIATLLVAILLKRRKRLTQIERIK